MALDQATQEPPHVAPLEPAPPPGEVRVVAREEVVRLRGALEASRLLFVDVGDVGPGTRGRLDETIDEAVEQALRARGGAPPGIGAASDRDAALSDQLYRARKVGKLGLSIALGSLGALVDGRAALDPGDGEVLRFLATATRDRPLVLLLDPSNVGVRIHGPPQPLTEALGIAPRKEPPKEPRVAKVVQRIEETPPPPTVDPPLDASTIDAALNVLRGVGRSTPIAALERAFVTGYSPLRTAILEDRLGAAGISRSEARAACASFAATFSRAYSEALPTFGATGKHPRMVFDLFDLSQRCARVHGARATHVVLVDALRWDLGLRVRARMARALARKAVCVEEQPLFALVPTTTSVQLDALTRGEDALRAPVRPERETAVVRGRSLDVLRRTRLGHRDLVKLDLLEGRLREPGLPERARLDALADEVSPILARHVAMSPVRTLVVVAGDHGFVLDEEGDTEPARQGGASPDEVFVPFFAWLVGGVH